jgi:transposase
VIQLSDDDRRSLEQLACGRRTPVAGSSRENRSSRGGGLDNGEIATKLKESKPAVGLWRARYAKLGLPEIEKDARRPGSPGKDRCDLEQKIVHMTTQQEPRNATQWSTRSLAAEFTIDHVFVHRVWQTHGLFPHRVRPFKPSKDKNFLKKLVDVSVSNWHHHSVCGPGHASKVA